MFDAVRIWSLVKPRRGRLCKAPSDAVSSVGWLSKGARITAVGNLNDHETLKYFSWVSSNTVKYTQTLEVGTATAIFVSENPCHCYNVLWMWNCSVSEPTYDNSMTSGSHFWCLNSYLFGCLDPMYSQSWVLNPNLDWRCHPLIFIDFPWSFRPAIGDSPWKPSVFIRFHHSFVPPSFTSGCPQLLSHSFRCFHSSKLHRVGSQHVALAAVRFRWC